MKQLYVMSFALFCCGLAPMAAAQQRFPEWRGSRVLEYAVWIASPIVAVGDVTNVAPYGEQHVDHLPPPMSPSVDKLYWCQGDFRAIAIIKGEFHLQRKKYLWASGLPGCELHPDGPLARRVKTRVWFLREEGDFLRPTYDGGTHLFLNLLDKWDDSAHIPAREQLGLLLLTPSSNSETLSDYSSYFFNVVDIACELLGNSQFIERIKVVVMLGNPALKDSACGFLKGQFGAGCGSPE